MNTKFVAALAACAAFAVAPALAQQKAPAPQKEEAAPKVSKAEVQKLVDGIKADKAKSKQFCELAKIQDQYAAAAEKKDDKKLDTLDKQMEDGAKKLGPDFERIMQSQMDDESTALIDALASSCGK
jgi:hypothetical protein